MAVNIVKYNKYTAFELAFSSEDYRLLGHDSM